nr:uncharacterized protein LOC127342258 [Lolium perenne]
MPVPGSQNRLPRPAKTQTIHGLVRAGDLAGFQRKLRENPALLNDKNPVVRASCAPPILSSRRRISLVGRIQNARRIEYRGINEVSSKEKMNLELQKVRDKFKMSENAWFCFSSKCASSICSSTRSVKKTERTRAGLILLL